MVAATAFDPKPWLDPISADNPSGAGLRNELKFHDLERLMQPKVEVVRDDRNNAVAQTQIPVDWTAVLGLADDLRQTGRDLRLLVIVARALANDQGLAGLGNGFDLIAASIDQYWPSLHPELRDSSSPRDAALRRTNALLQMESDQDGLLGDLSRNVFLTPRLAGPITGRDLELGMLDAQTVLQAAPGISDKERAALIEKHETLIKRVKAGCKEFAAQDAPAMTALREGAAQAVQALSNLEQALGKQLGGTAETLPGLGRFLRRMAATLDTAATPAQPEAAVSAPVTNVTSQTPSVAIPSAPAITGGGAIPDRLNSRGDVEKLLDLIIDFYDRTEPSSPIPHLARRMRRMVPMDFLALMEEMAPSGLKEFKSLAGVSEAKKGD